MKRLIAFSDGLWTSPMLPADSNLGLLTSALALKSADDIHQIACTDPFQALGPVLACGRRLDFLEQSVCSLYQQLARNYSPGDSIWLFGFSRGSFVARCCLGLIRNVGLLRREHLHRLGDAFHIYRTRWGADARNAVLFRDACSHRVRVRFLGVFDTLGERGIPAPRQESPAGERLLFHDNVLGSAVEHACHALAIDEWRREFPACLWRTQPERERTEQCWFTGSHRDIGGIRGDPALANIALRWMAGRASALGLALDTGRLEQAMAARCRDQHPEHGGGQVRRTGTHARPIGAANGDETLHPSAEQRFLRQQGYRPANLKAFMERHDQIQLPL